MPGSIMLYKVISMNKKDRVISYCILCGKKIEDVPSKKRIYCSRQCKVQSMKKKIKYTCTICGNIFEVFEKYNNGNPSKFCSQKCRSSQKITKKCLHCGKEFMVKPSLSSQKFCSRNCQVQSNIENKKRTCINCGKEFMVNYPSNQYKYCSHECRLLINRIETKCRKCGKLFMQLPSEHKNYCSLSCSNSAEHKVSILVNNTLARISKGECVSKTELLLKDHLVAAGFKPQYITEFGSIDYANLDKKIAVFVDGVFWHGRIDNHWRTTSFADKIRKNRKRDRWQNKHMKASGWIVLRYWDDYVRRHTDECVADILNHCCNR